MSFADDAMSKLDLYRSVALGHAKRPQVRRFLKGLDEMPEVERRVLEREAMGEPGEEEQDDEE